MRVLNWALRNEKDAKAHDLLACVLYDKGHFQRAVQLWREARRIDPTSALYARNLAVALFSHLHQRNEALELLVEAMELDPNNDQLKQEFL
ncbi:MAG: tetratricopeptide repeat protein, partial [Merdibacter sp.]